MPTVSENLQPHDLDGEIWRDCTNYKGFQVSNYARVRRIKDGRICPHLKVTESPYIRVCLRTLEKDENGKPTMHTQAPIHLLMATEFLERPPHLVGLNSRDVCIDHIDSNNKNNDISNLQWVTRTDNARKSKSKDKYKLHLREKHIKDLSTQDKIYTLKQMIRELEEELEKQ